MKETILFCGYRDWAVDIFCSLLPRFRGEKDFVLVRNSKELKDKLDQYKVSTILFIGWSWIIKEDIIDKYNCICLHPSPLPKYRGGCPIQHQILEGEEESAVTLFLMDEKVDHGPILWQKKFSLSGSLDNIFTKITSTGTLGLLEIIKKYQELNNFNWGAEQNHEEATYYKRRKPEESEIKLSDLEGCSAKQIYNKIRALQDPYPNAYIVCKDGTKLYLTEAKYDRD
jgi:methionyl-tRNA formyltransferase